MKAIQNAGELYVSHVSHSKLLDLLEQIGVRGVRLELFRNYLTNRSQWEKIGDCISNEKIIVHDVSQGSVLGPFVFSLRINDIFELEASGIIIFCADDTAILYTSSTWEDLKRNDDLHKIFLWQ